MGRLLTFGRKLTRLFTEVHGPYNPEPEAQKALEELGYTFEVYVPVIAATGHVAVPITIITSPNGEFIATNPEAREQYKRDYASIVKTLNEPKPDDEAPAADTDAPAAAPDAPDAKI